jgi:hypothetical protein
VNFCERLYHYITIWPTVWYVLLRLGGGHPVGDLNQSIHEAAFGCLQRKRRGLSPE